MPDEPKWLTIAREVRAIAQTGLTFTADGFDNQRYRRLQDLAALMLAQGSLEHEPILHLLRQEKGYATPKVDVRGAAFVDGRVLMVRELSDGKWTLPGGWADVNQSAGECVVREIAEESGFKARAVGWICIRLAGLLVHAPERAICFLENLAFAVFQETAKKLQIPLPHYYRGDRQVEASIIIVV